MRVRRNYLVNKRQVAAASNASAKPNSSPHYTHLTSWRKPKSPMKSNRRMSPYQTQTLASCVMEASGPSPVLIAGHRPATTSSSLNGGACSLDKSSDLLKDHG